MGKDGDLRSTRTVIEEGPSNEGQIHVGPDHQAVIPDYNPTPYTDDTQRELLMWQPQPSKYARKDLDDYVETARHDYGYSEEQALTLLLWHYWDIDRAFHDLGYYHSLQGDSNQYACGLPATDKSLAECHWCADDCSLFEQALFGHGKVFGRISRVLQDKPVKQVIQHYYTWKRFRSLSSYIGCCASDDPSVKASLEEIPSVPLCPQCGLPSLNIALSRQPLCEKCQSSPEKRRWTRRLPDGVYFDMSEFERILTDEAAARSTDRKLKANWISALREYQRLKQARDLDGAAKAASETDETIE